MMAKLTNKQIEDISIECVMEHLRSKGEKPEIRKHGADIVCSDKYIDVKGCLKKATNLRMCKQVLDAMKKAARAHSSGHGMGFIQMRSSGSLAILSSNFL